MTAQDSRAVTVRWVAVVFAATVLLQRFSVPGLPEVAVLLPVLLACCAWALMTGVLTLDGRRLAAWLLAAGVTAVAVHLQLVFVHQPRVSISSWALFMTTWSVFTLRVVDNSRRTYVMALQAVVRVSTVLAGACVVMMASQIAGLGYRDWLADIVPDSLLLPGFVITYPVEYGSEIMRANAWLGLEPSIVSAQIGVGLLAALLVGAPRVVVLGLLAGLFCTVSGSGFAIVLVGVVVMIAFPARRSLRRYALPAGILLLVAAGTNIGGGIFQRVTEVSSSESSANRRALMPYEHLFPFWTDNVTATLLGLGPGSSQKLAEESGILGLLVPTPIKIFFDYGLLAGLVLAAFVLLCYFGSPSRAMAGGLLVSMWLLQPGTTTVVIIAPVLLLVTVWSRRPEPPLETLSHGGHPAHRQQGGVRRRVLAR